MAPEGADRSPDALLLPSTPANPVDKGTLTPEAQTAIGATAERQELPGAEGATAIIQLPDGRMAQDLGNGNLKIVEAKNDLMSGFGTKVSRATS